MRIVAICSTKNEADIIEAFVRLNARVFDTFFFADDSTDATRAVLDLLGHEGYDINYLPQLVHEGEHNQPHTSQLHLAYVADLVNPDWVFFLDADEIIVAESKACVLEEMRGISLAGFLTAPWRTYVPVSLGYFESRSPLSECFVPRVEREPFFSKVSIPGRLARVVSTTPGNHMLRSLVGAPLTETLSRTHFLAHFPVRSAEQILVKNIIATHNLSSRADALAGEGTHVVSVLEAIRARRYRLTLEDLVSIANGYAMAEKSAAVSQTPAAVSDPHFESEWKYRDLVRIDVVARLDAELERYARDLRRARERARPSSGQSVRLQLHPPDPVA